MKADKLFLEKDCPDCGAIRAIIDMEAVTRDDFRGPDDQELRVFSSLSNAASIELLEKFDLKGKLMPVLVTHDGKVVTTPKRIISHLRQNDMSTVI
jgi:hypothetical protein